MSPQAKQLKQLQAKWYARLKKEGFEDIEQDENLLKNWSSSRLRKSRNSNNEIEQTLLYNESKQSYYRLAGFFVNDYAFESELDHMVWSYHAEGKSLRQMSKLLKAQGNDISYTRAKEIIHKLRAIMLKHYKESHE